MSSGRSSPGAGGQRRNGVGATGPTPKSDLARRLAESILGDERTRHLGETLLPSREAVAELVDLLRSLMFPGFFGRRGLTRENLPLRIEELLARIEAHTEAQVRSVLRYVRHMGPKAEQPAPADEDAECDRTAHEIARSFLDQLPEIRRLLSLDVQAAYDGDPAALHTDETIFCYPGVEAIFSHRVAHALYRLGVPLLPRIIHELAHSRTGIDINPGAQIGESFFIDHGGGVVIGETSVIGKHVRIYQGVTLGAKNIEKDKFGRVIRGTKRHPTICDRVTIYAGAVILGGDTEIGEDCIVAGSIFVTRSVPPGHVVRQEQPKLVLRTHREHDGAGKPGVADGDFGH